MRVKMVYCGRLASTNKIFDSCTKGNPFGFQLGKGEVIKGQSAFDTWLIGPFIVCWIEMFGLPKSWLDVFNSINTHVQAGIWALLA